jgi:hypothetical protein
MFKNESMIIEEWLMHYISEGVEHFYLIDNGSNDDYESKISYFNNITIFKDNECNDIEYYHLECEHHSAIFANGVLSESYFEANNRHVFENSIRLPSNFNLKKMLSLR